MNPLYLTFGLMGFCFSNISASRVMLSLYALDLGASPFEVGILVATFYMFPLVLSWPVGTLADRIGSRWLLLFGTLTGTVGMLVAYFGRAMPALYAAGVLAGLSFTFYNVLLPNLVGLASSPETRTRNFSNSALVGAATLFTGPMIGGFAVDFSGHATACLFAVGLTSSAALLVLLWGGVLPGGSRQPGASGTIRDSLKDPAVVRILITSTLVQLGQDLFQFYMPIYGHGIGLSASAIGAVLGTFAGAYFFVRMIMPRLIAATGEEKLLAYSFYVSGAGFLLVPFFTHGVALGVVAFVVGLGMGCGHPITMMLLFSRSAEGRSGETFGLRQTTNNIVRVSAPTVFGLIASAFGLLPVFCISALLMGAGGVLTLPQRDAREEKPG